jgi:hypothetical protein
VDTIVHGLSAGIGGTIHTYLSGKYQHAAVQVEADCASTNTLIYITSEQTDTSAGHIHTNRNLASGRTEPEFIDIIKRLKRYLLRGQAAQQDLQLFYFRVVGKIYLVHFHKTTIQR